ncbi:MAG: hypothetical protein ACREKL_03635 [Chthoniobacterales bacterium]
MRAPFADEADRVARYLSAPPHVPGEVHCNVAVAGRIERIVGAAALVVGGDPPEAMLAVKTNDCAETLAPRLVRGLLDEAARRGVTRVWVAGAVARGTEIHAALTAMGFRSSGAIEDYRMNVGPLYERLDRAFARLRERGMVPADASVAPPMRGWRTKAAAFLDECKPSLSRPLALESEGFSLNKSLLLVVGGRVRGALFLGHRDGESVIGYRLLAPELRGAVSWGNVMLLRESLREGLAVGLKMARFSVHPEEHAGTRLLAQQSDAELVAVRDNLEMEIRAERDGVGSFPDCM